MLLCLGQKLKADKIDSLQQLIRTEKNDTSRIKQTLLLGKIYYFELGQLDSAIRYYNLILQQTVHPSLMRFRFPALIFHGHVVREKGEYDKASDDYFKALQIAEDLNDKRLMADAYSGLAVVYSMKNRHEKAREYYNKVILIFQELGLESKLGGTYNNLGLSYMSTKENSIALKLFLKSLDLQKKSKNNGGIATAAENIGLVYESLGDHDLALNYYTQAISLWRLNKDPHSIAINLGYMAFTLNNSRKYLAAIDTAEKALILAKEAGALSTQRDLHNYLYNSFSAIKDHEKALFHFREKTKLNDSLSSEARISAFTRYEMNYTFSKQQYKDSVEHALEVRQKEKQLKTEKIIRNTSLLVLVAFVILIYFLMKAFRANKEANKKVLLQKELIEEKQKEVIDSINYAKRIQTALLAGDKLLSENLKEYFIFYRPKDIVAGDFYWATRSENKFLLIAGDCTGHGVPGAFMSLLNISTLSETIKDRKVNEPAQVLNIVRREIVEALNPDGSIIESKDGMDCVLLALDFEQMKMEYAAANNSFYLIRNKLLTVLRADKMPVGKSHDDSRPFTPHTLDLMKGDLIYIFTDGFADQFGGPQGKKFKYRQLQELLLNIHELPLTEQRLRIIERFDEWKGQQQQVDDVCVIGIKI